MYESENVAWLLPRRKLGEKDVIFLTRLASYSYFHPENSPCSRVNLLRNFKHPSTLKEKNKPK